LQNDRVQVSSGPLNVRATASATGTLLGQQQVGALGTVTGGPISADGFNWWNINYDTGADGWSAEDFLVKVSTSPPPPPPSPTKPVVAITAPTNGSAFALDQAISFTATVTKGIAPFHYHWLFADGTVIVVDSNSPATTVIKSFSRPEDAGLDYVEVTDSTQLKSDLAQVQLSIH